MKLTLSNSKNKSELPNDSNQTFQKENLDQSAACLNRVQKIKSKLINPLGISDKVREVRDAKEVKLFIKIQQGDLDSFQSIYKRYNKPIIKYVQRQVGSLAIAEELTQDIFLKMYRSKDTYRPEHTVSAWVWTIVRNTTFDHFRSQANLKEIPQANTEGALTSQYELDSATSLWSEPYSEENAEALMIQQAEVAKIMELMSALSRQQKEAIFLRLVKKLSYQQISASMNLSLSAVKSLISRAKQTLLKLNRGKIPHLPPGSVQ